MNPMNINTTTANVAAFVTTEGDGDVRWTELRVFHFSDPKVPRKWLAEVRRVSTLGGEVTKVRRMSSASLERALKLFEPSHMGIAASEAAREWAEEMGIPSRVEQSRPPADPVKALAWLFGVEPAALSLRAVGKAFDTGESTMRQAIAGGRDIRVPLRALLPFVDRYQFRAAVTRGTDRG